MAFDEDDHEVAQILLQFPRLSHDSDIRNMFPFSWASKKKRSLHQRSSTIFRSRKTPLSPPKSKIRITLKIKKTSENHHQNSSNFYCAVNGESSSKMKKKKMMTQQASETKPPRPFLLPDLNLPPLSIEEEGEKEDHTLKGINPHYVSARDEDGRNPCCYSKDLVSSGIRFR